VIGIERAECKLHEQQKTLTGFPSLKTHAFNVSINRGLLGTIWGRDKSVVLKCIGQGALRRDTCIILPRSQEHLFKRRREVLQIQLSIISYLKPPRSPEQQQ
jgi:hypothetical protein